MSDSPSLRVLVVDDDVDGASMLSEGLRMLGHEVTVAASGREALEVAGPDFDVAFIDVAMPVVSGLDVARELRRRGLGLRLVAFTASGMQAECAAAGFDAFALKPVELGSLVGLARGENAP